MKALECKFAVGSKVRVKAGVFSDTTPALCMEGWRATVLDVIHCDPPVYVLMWSEGTVEAMPPQPQMCFMDDWCGCDYEGIMCYEEELDLDDGEGDVVSPRAGSSAVLPASGSTAWQDRPSRIRSVFGLEDDAPLPPVNADSLLTYARYLRGAFDVGFQQAKLAVSLEEGDWLCVGKISLAVSPDAGVLAWVTGELTALCELRFHESSYNYEALEDYKYWFENYRQ